MLRQMIRTLFYLSIGLAVAGYLLQAFVLSKMSHP